MSAEEALTLTPWEKFRRHRRVPWKLFLHLVILGLCWLQMQQYTTQVVPYFLNSNGALRDAFFGYDAPDGRVLAERSESSGLLTVSIAEGGAFRSAVAGVSVANLDFPSRSVDDYTALRCAGSGGTAPPCTKVLTNPGVHVQIEWNNPSLLTLPIPPVPCGDASACAFDIGEDPATCHETKDGHSGSPGCLGQFADFSVDQWDHFFQRIASMR